MAPVDTHRCEISVLPLTKKLCHVEMRRSVAAFNRAVLVPD